MSEHFDFSDDRDKKRRQIIGLGEKSLRKSYYPQLQRQIEELNETKLFLEQRTEALLNAMNDLQKERSRAEESERKYRIIVETASEGIWVVGPDFKTVFVNSKMTEIVGYPLEEMIGKPLVSFIYSEDRFDHEERMKNHFQNLPENYECRFLRKDDGIIWTMISATPIYDNEHRFNGYFAMVTDISKRKRYEDELRDNGNRLKELNANLERIIKELASANKDLESFSYSVAHDLRNPLKVITDLTNIIIEDYGEKLDEEEMGHLDRIKTVAKRMNSIICDMLALSKISMQEMEIVDLDLSELAHLSIKELSAADPDRKVNVKIQNGLKAHADARLMSITLGNLLGNAWKYTSKTVHPQIEFGAFNRDGQRVFYIKDNGVGFDMCKADTLFVPFHRLHSEKEFKGTGVGLTIVERAIRRQGGNIWAESDVNNGAVFYFTLK
jgi:PAS domain S-box-containing protein